jgi:hypothetical protein
LSEKGGDCINLPEFIKWITTHCDEGLKGVHRENFLLALKHHPEVARSWILSHLMEWITVYAFRSEGVVIVNDGAKFASELLEHFKVSFEKEMATLPA